MPRARRTRSRTRLPTRSQKRRVYAARRLGVGSESAGGKDSAPPAAATARTEPRTRELQQRPMLLHYGHCLGNCNDRPWLELYHRLLPAPAPPPPPLLPTFGDADREPDDRADDKQQQQQPWRRRQNLGEQLPHDIIRLILRHLSAADTAAAARVCRAFRDVAAEPALWRAHCLATWCTRGGDTERELARRAWRYGGWRRMYTLRPRLRFDGLYVLKAQHLRLGGADNTATGSASCGSRSVYFVSHYRYLRFFPNGKVLGLTTPDDPLRARHRMAVPTYVTYQGQVVTEDTTAAATAMAMTAAQEQQQQQTPADTGAKLVPSCGQYTFDEHTRSLSVSLPLYQPRYPDMRAGTVFLSLLLSDSSAARRGANDRLTLLEHCSVLEGEPQPVPHEVRPSQCTFCLVPFGARYRRVARYHFEDSDDVKMFNRVQLHLRTGGGGGGGGGNGGGGRSTVQSKQQQQQEGAPTTAAR